MFTRRSKQNGMIERVWQSRFGTARVLLAAANLPPRFRVQAVLMANWLHNRLPALKRGGKSPYELLTGKRPDMTYLRAFRCAAAVFRSANERTKVKGLTTKLTADHFGVYLGPEAGRPGGPPPTQQSAAPPPTEGWRLWSGEDGSARQTRVCAWAAGAPHEKYTIRSAWIQKQGGSPTSLQNSKDISRKVPETIRDSNRQRQRDLGRLHK